MLDPQQHVPANDGGLECRAREGPRVHLEFDRQGLLAVAGKTQLVEQPGKANEGAVHRLLIADPRQVGVVSVPPQVRPDRLQVGSEIVAGPGSLEGEIEIFGISSDGVEEAQGRAPLEARGTIAPAR